MNYDFAVALEDIYLKNGRKIPRMKAVVDIEETRPVSIVSDTYKLIEHKMVMDEAMQYVRKLGTPTTNFHISKTGAKVVGEFTYADKTVAVRRGDLVGLRVYVENTYNATAKVKVRIGGMVLKCLNGMMMHEDVFSLDVLHKGEPEFNFPKPEVVMTAFEGSAKKLKQFDNYLLDQEDYTRRSVKAFEDGVITERSLQRIEKESEGKTAWDLYNDFTYDITHNENKRATYVGRLGRLNKVSAWMEDEFFGDRVQ